MGRRDWDDEYSYRYSYPPYVPVAQRRAQAAKEVARRLKKGQAVSPVKIEGRAIASTFWGKAWCTNLESYSDYANRLPRGRTYVRNGSVIHLAVEGGRIRALVSGSEVYEIEIDVDRLPKPEWQALKTRSRGHVGTLVELLQGRLSKAMMELVTDREHGLFPKPKQIHMRCSCPDGAYMCKHLAAVLYGVGHRLDASPELLFVLRGVDQMELIEQAVPAPIGAAPAATLADADLGDIFGIEIDAPASPPAKTRAKAKAPAKAAKAAPAKKTKSAKAKALKKTAKAKAAATAKSSPAPSPAKAKAWKAKPAARAAKKKR